MLSELYSDQRTHGFQGPSRAVSHPRACTVGGGSFATSQDGSRCVVAGKDVLRILRIRDPSPSRSNNNVFPSRPSSQYNLASERLYTGPGGATVEAGPNLWTSSGLKMDSAPTDVVWGRGNFDNKIVTSARNGEIVYWDINKSGSKFETRIKEHNRAVNKLAISPVLPYLIVSGSQDGYLRVWDLRTPPNSRMKVYHPTAVLALALCPVSSNPLTVCTGLKSGNIQRWDIRNKASPLERITLAHASSVLSMDWQLPGMREAGLGWLVTGGMDRRVKIWDLCLPAGTTIPVNAQDRDALLLNKRMGPRPFRTLHTAFPVRNVCWRSGYDCEVAVVSNNESESETVEVWDIRRGWIAKWALEGTEGGITDIAFASSHTLWAQHANGTFAQHDLRESFRPLDFVPRVAMSWAASGNLAFVANKQPVIEVPFDDIDPLKKPVLQEIRLHPKGTSDPMYIPFQQTLGVHNVPLIDHASFTRLANSYVFQGDKLRVCQTNAEIASQAGQYHAARVWLLLLSQLMDLREPSPPPSVSSAALPTTHVDAPRPSFSPAAGSNASVSASERLSTPPHSSPRNLIETRALQSTPVPADRRHGQDTPPSSSSSSPGLRTVTLQGGREAWPNNSTPPYHSSLVSPRSIRRASTVLPATPRPQRPSLRRASISTPGTGSGSGPSTSNHKHADVGEGALDDSDSGTDSDGSASSDGAATASDPIGKQQPRPSPLSRLLVSREDSPDGHLAGDERSVDEYDSDASSHSDVSHSPRSTSSSSAASGRSLRKRIPPRRVHREESHSSIRTVTAPPSDPPSSVRLHPLPEEAMMSTESDVSTRRPSLTSGLGLGLSNMDDHNEVTHTHAPPSRLSEPRRREVQAAEERLRDIGWRALREAVEWFADKGDVQMCALLAIIVPTELDIGPGRAARFVEAYVDLLARMQLHTAAAHVRKYTSYAAVRDTTQVQTTLYTSCGQCRKPIRGVGGPTLCSTCCTPPSLCAVCHLPSRTLLIHCAICGHGAHVACMRSFYLARPLTALPSHGVVGHSTEDSSGSAGSGSMSTVYYSMGEETEEEKDEEREIKMKMRVWGRACAAGCGHHCWATARPP